MGAKRGLWGSARGQPLFCDAAKCQERREQSEPFGFDNTEVTSLEAGGAHA